jgi:hypothetical protein
LQISLPIFAGLKNLQGKIFYGAGEPRENSFDSEGPPHPPFLLRQKKK